MSSRRSEAVLQILEKERHRTLSGILAPILHLVAVREVLGGRGPARCWSDGEREPAVAVAWDLVNAFVLCAADGPSGAAVARLGTLLGTGVFPEAANATATLCVRPGERQRRTGPGDPG